eukprot:11288230-Alexandrium_andersonii.AAC.1
MQRHRTALLRALAQAFSTRAHISARTCTPERELSSCLAAGRPLRLRPAAEGPVSVPKADVRA